MSGNFCGSCGNVLVKKARIRKKRPKSEIVAAIFLIILGLTIMPRFYITVSIFAELSKYFIIFATPFFAIAFIVYNISENKK